MAGNNDFGGSTSTATSLTGNIYFLPEGTTKLPDYTGMTPVAVLYTEKLALAPRKFDQGFPGVPNNRTEWFGIRYDGKFTTAAPGAYKFRVNSDDGAKLWVDGTFVVDNDGTHPPQSKDATITLSAGAHTIRVDYFQGPKFDIALELFVTPPGKTEQYWAPAL